LEGKRVKVVSTVGRRRRLIILQTKHRKGETATVFHEKKTAQSKKDAHVLDS